MCPPQESPIRFFASSHQLHQLAPRTRLLCVLFLFGILLQAVSGVLMHHHGPGWSPTSIATYYRGDDAPAQPDPAAFGLTEDDTVTPPPAPARPLGIARSFGSLLEVAHLHLVAMPLVLFVIAHLFSMTPLGRTAIGGALCYIGFIAAFADIAAPFAVRYIAAEFAFIKLLAFLLLEGSLIAMIFGTLHTGITSFRQPPANTGSGSFTRAD